MSHSVADIFLGNRHQPGKKARISPHSERGMGLSLRRLA